MNWLPFAFLTIIFYAFFDFFLKLGAGKINSYLSAVIINLFALIIAFIYLAVIKTKNGAVDSTRLGIVYSAVAGVLVGLASVFFTKMFSTGVNLSLAVPVVRIGMVFLASVLGIIFLKEGFNTRYFLGFVLSLAGLYLIVAK
ncbi:hypothetical protein ISS85_04950 [Candidatus Microgenomates bacterium]|nr:hypothetical protein [Candidatus Microgenomates bacterium]